MKFLELQFCIFVVLRFLCQWNIGVSTFFAWKTRPTNQVRRSWKVATGWKHQLKLDGMGKKLWFIHIQLLVGHQVLSIKKWHPKIQLARNCPCWRGPLHKLVHEVFWWNLQAIFLVWIQITVWVHQKINIHPNWDPKKIILGGGGGYPSPIKPSLNEEEHQWHALQVRCFWGFRTSLAHFNDRNFQAVVGICWERNLFWKKKHSNESILTLWERPSKRKLTASDGVPPKSVSLGFEIGHQQNFHDIYFRNYTPTRDAFVK